MRRAMHDEDAGAGIADAKRCSTGIAYETIGIAKAETDELMTRIAGETREAHLAAFFDFAGPVIRRVKVYREGSADP